MAANKDDKLKPGGKISDKDRFIISPEKPQSQEAKGAEVVRSIAAVKKPHLAPGELSAIWASEKAGKK